MLVAIKAYDQIYGGLHGMNSSVIIEVDNFEDAEMYAVQESIEVITSYGSIMEELEEEARFNIEDEDDEEEFEYAFDEAIDNDVAYDCYIITKKTDETIEELENKFYNNEKAFIQEYCDEHF